MDPLPLNILNNQSKDTKKRKGLVSGNAVTKATHINTHTHTYTNTQTHTNTHTHSLSLLQNNY